MEIGANKVIRSLKTARVEFHSGHYQAVFHVCFVFQNISRDHRYNIRLDKRHKASHSCPQSLKILLYFSWAGDIHVVETFINPRCPAQALHLRFEKLFPPCYFFLCELISQVRCVL